MTKDELAQAAVTAFGEKAVHSIDVNDYGDGFIYVHADLGRHAWVKVDQLLTLMALCDLQPREVAVRDKSPNLLEIKVDLDDRTPVDLPQPRPCPQCGMVADKKR